MSSERKKSNSFLDENNKCNVEMPGNHAVSDKLIEVTFIWIPLAL